VPELHIITGSNGAGKSTVGSDYLPEHIFANHTVFDGDRLFLEKRKEFSQQTKSFKEARNLASEWLEQHFVSLVDQALNRGDDFVYEGHFSSAGTWQTPIRFRDHGYSIHLIFFGLADTDLSELRVVERSKLGGHYVNPIEVDSNFRGNLFFLDQNFEWIDELLIVDTSAVQHKLLLNVVNDRVVFQVSRDELPQWFTTFITKITSRYFPTV